MTPKGENYSVKMQKYYFCNRISLHSFLFSGAVYCWLGHHFSFALHTKKQSYY